MAQQTKAEREAAGQKAAATRQRTRPTDADEAKKAAGEAVEALATAAKATAKAATQAGKAVASARRPADTSYASAAYRFVIGIRRSRPNARGVILIPGGAWRRLYSARSTSASTRSIASAGSPRSSSCSRSASSST